MAEFETEEGIRRAAAQVRHAGFRRWDTHTPYPVHGLDEAMGLRPSLMPWICLAGGITGGVGGFLMQCWMNAKDYPFLISGKPLVSAPAFIPITFELTILLSAFGAFFGMLALNGLPRFYHFAFHSERFRRATSDRYFISIEASDPRFTPEETREFMQAVGSSHVEVIEEE